MTILPGEDILAEHYNALLAEAARAQVVEGPLPVSRGVDDHPWRVRVAAGPEEKTWTVRMTAGFVQDTEATVAYRRTDDPRGWEMPEGYPASKVIGDVVERSWREAQAPELRLESERDFVAATVRPRALRGAADIEKEVLRASVYVSTRLVGWLAGRTLPARFRTWAGRLPSASASAVRDVREIARLWLLRDADGGEEVRVEQLEYFDLWAAGVEPVKLLPDYRPLVGSFGGIGLGFADGALDAFNIGANMLTQAVNAALANIAADINSVEYWSV